MVKLHHHRSQVLVLGGGPAGGAAALELAQSGCDVVLLERQNVPGWKIGETLPPEARVHLHRLQHWETFRQEGHLPCHGIVSCWGSSAPVETDFMRNPYGHGWQLDRVVFESSLLKAAAEASCRVLFGAEVSRVQERSQGWHVETTFGEFDAEWLLDCSGRNALLSESGFGGSFQSLQDYVSLYCILDPANGTDKDGRTYVESHSSGWAYSALMPNGSRVVAFLTDRDLISPEVTPAGWMKQCVSECSQISAILNSHEYSSIENVRVVNAASGWRQHVAGSNWLLVGDAAMTFDPLSGWGSIKALVSAAMAVKCVLHGDDYQTACDNLWDDYLAKYKDYYRAEQRWCDAPFWVRRHQNV